MIHREKDPSLKTLLVQQKLAEMGFYQGELDNWWGHKSELAYSAWLADRPRRPHVVVASTFANESDVAAFKRCKLTGKSDNECFAVGDNGEGYWGRDTTSEIIPMCALPPEDIRERWGSVDAGKDKPVLVTFAGPPVNCFLADTEPHWNHIYNGAGIDLNPGAVKALKIPAGGMVFVTWQWVIDRDGPGIVA